MAEQKTSTKIDVHPGVSVQCQWEVATSSDKDDDGKRGPFFVNLSDFPERGTAQFLDVELDMKCGFFFFFLFSC